MPLDSPRFTYRTRRALELIALGLDPETAIERLHAEGIEVSLAYVQQLASRPSGRAYIAEVEPVAREFLWARALSPALAVAS